MALGDLVLYGQVRSQRKSRLVCAVTCFACAVAIFVPTSVNGVILFRVSAIFYCVLAMLVAVHFFLDNKVTLHKNVFLALTFLAMIGWYSVVSPLRDVSVGILLPYVSALLVLSTTIVTGSERVAVLTFLLCSVALTLLNLSVIFGWGMGLRVLESFYRDYYTELFEYTVVWHKKPVSVFGSHAIASMAYFIIFVVLIELAWLRRAIVARCILGGFACLFLVFLALLLSKSAFGFLCAGVAYGGISVSRRTGMFGRVVLCAAVISALVGVAVFLRSRVGVELYDLWSGTLKTVLEDPTSGFAARYGAGGRLDPTLAFMADHPFAAIGLTWSEKLSQGDSFLATYVLRAGLLGYAAVLVMLFRFVSYNVREAYLRWTLLGTVLVSDVFYPLLLATKVLFLWLFAIIVLTCARKEASPRWKRRINSEKVPEALV